jgi:general secretion pathway protein E/type IV pilus assembly protein PilB
MRTDDVLIRDGHLSADQVSAIRDLASSQQIRFDQAVSKLGYMTEEAVRQSLGKALGLRVVALADRAIERDILDAVPRKLIFRHQVMPIERDGDFLVIAMANPLDLDAVDSVHEATGLSIEPVLAPEEEIATLIKSYFGVGGETVGAMVGGSDFEVVDGEGTSDDADELAQEASVVKLVNEIINEAIEQRTSDVHIEPTERGLRIRYRIDGVLQVQSLPPEIHRFAPAIVSRLKIMAKLNISEKRLPQDGRIRLRTNGRDIDIRVSIIPMAHGEGVVLRVLDKGALKFSLVGLGMSSQTLHIWKQLIELPHGIILVTGPTGSGKTTTLYSALQEIAKDQVKVITVEDPVEYNFDRIQQIQVQTKIGLTFAAGLRSILRHDPDVVLVGEIRDVETAEIAIQAALTGHLVLSTLHTNDAATAFTRLTDMGVEPFLVASTVEGVMAQRLVRSICRDCKTTFEPEHAELPPDFPRMDRPIVLHRGTGCRNCRQTGYRGRQGIYELLAITDPIREMVIERASSSAIKSQARKEGLITLREDAYRKLLGGETTVEELLRVTKSDDSLLRANPSPSPVLRLTGDE